MGTADISLESLLALSVQHNNYSDVADQVFMD